MAESFTATSWRRRPEDGAFEFAYACSRFGAFKEIVAFPGVAATADIGKAAGRLAALLHAALGVSYYKAAAAPALAFPALEDAPAARAFMSALYREGLGEFFVRNALPYPPEQTLALSGASMGARAKPAPRDGRAIVAFGGGKDSYVALDILEQAGWRTEPISAALSDRVARQIQATIARPVTIVRRALDPRLIEANNAGALNGHVPITAVNALLVLLHAELTGGAHVVFANERSADEATMNVDGHAVNHQWSKSFAAERLLRAAAEEAGAGAEFFSVLRPFSELWVARRLARLPEALKSFRSCNRNWAQDTAPARAWCGECAKCAFTALITAPFMSRTQSRAVYGGDILDGAAAVEHLAATAGLDDARPWDCVGGAEETAAALHRLAGAPDWADARAVATLAPKVVAARGAEALERAWAEAFSCAGTGFLPDPLLRLCDDDAVGA
jgi:hypothetical protein